MSNFLQSAFVAAFITLLALAFSQPHKSSRVAPVGTAANEATTASAANDSERAALNTSVVEQSAAGVSLPAEPGALIVGMAHDLDVSANQASNLTPAPNTPPAQPPAPTRSAPAVLGQPYQIPVYGFRGRFRGYQRVQPQPVGRTTFGSCVGGNCGGRR